MDEQIELAPTALSEVRKLITGGEIEDAKSIAALLLVLADEGA